MVAPPAASPAFHRPEPAVGIDVRCSSRLLLRPAPEGRCQLFAGHDGPHALMYGRDGARFVCTWRKPDGPVVNDGSLQRPWMFGYPVPAWFEDDPATELIS